MIFRPNYFTRSLAAVVLAAALCADVSAQKIWTGADSAWWQDNGNWDPMFPPTSSDDVVIDQPAGFVNWPVLSALSGVARDLDIGIDHRGQLQLTNNAVLTVSVLQMGQNTSLNRMWVSGDSQFASDLATIGFSGGRTFADTNELGVVGAGSQWQNAAGVVVGDGSGGTVTVQEGASFTSTSAILGNQTNIEGRILVDGIGSSWSATGTITVGRNGSGRLIASNGGMITATHGIVLAEFAGSTGRLDIDGMTQAGLLNTTSVSGGAGTASVHFLHGEDLYSFVTAFAEPVILSGAITLYHDGPGRTILKGTQTHTHGTAVFNGELIVRDAQLNHPGAPLVVAQNAGHTALMRIDQASVVTTGGAFISFSSGAFGEAIVSQSAIWNVNGNLMAGNNGPGFLTVANGGQINVGGLAVGFNQPAAQQSITTVADAGSVINVIGALQVGGNGPGSGMLDILPGGLVKVGTNAVIGPAAGSADTLKIGLESAMEVAGNLTIGQDATVEISISTTGNGHIEANQATINSGARLVVTQEPGELDPEDEFILLETNDGISGSFTQLELPAGMVIDQSANQLKLRMATPAEDQVFIDRFEP
jgi:T5SS/PEP-CTERM-associated repeat protein